MATLDSQPANRTIRWFRLENARPRYQDIRGVRFARRMSACRYQAPHDGPRQGVSDGSNACAPTTWLEASAERCGRRTSPAPQSAEAQHSIEPTTVRCYANFNTHGPYPYFRAPLHPEHRQTTRLQGNLTNHVAHGSPLQKRSASDHSPSLAAFRPCIADGGRRPYLQQRLLPLVFVYRLRWL